MLVRRVDDVSGHARSDPCITLQVSRISYLAESWARSPVAPTMPDPAVPARLVHEPISISSEGDTYSFAGRRA